MSFSVYRSSAGSGKTFTLVKEYLKMILVDPGEFSHILAITFTNKAANEMKDRILMALQEMSKGDSPAGGMVMNPLLSQLINETGLTAVEIELSAARALEMILHNYADFAIGTIDSFSHKLIRTFAHDFGLPVNFNVELDGAELLSTAVDLLLDRVGDDKELTTLLVDFLATRMEEDRGWNIDMILSGFASILMDEEGQRQIVRIKGVSLDNFRKISEELYTAIRQFEKVIRDLGRQGAGLIKAKDIPVRAFYQGEKGVAKYFLNLASGRMDKMEPNSYVITTFTDDKWLSGKATPTERGDIETVKPGLVEIYDQIGRESELHKPLYLLRKLLAKTIYPLAVLNEIEKVMNTFKAQNNLVHISEFNARIAGIVMNEPVPYIYERLGEKYHHLFIDEFQDTSALQWMNYIPLVENALAGGFFNLVVGDGKQAIYRWRSGDVEQFNALPAIPGSDLNEVLRQREQVLTSHFKRVNLHTNYRSKAEIVDFNNRFFTLVAGRVLAGGKENIFEGVVQVFDPEKSGGFISLEYPDSGEGDMNYDDLTLNRILEIILEAARENFSLNDMAILCRSNRNASRIARFLLEHDIDVLSAESLLVSNSPRVRFVIAYLRFLFEPRNDVVIAEIGQFLKDEVFLKTPGRPMDGNLMLLPVYDLCEALISSFDLNNETDPYLRFFLDAVLKFSVKMSTDVAEFLSWWEKNRDKISIIVPEGIDAVRVMTIHKAKGLQFPLVILPHALDIRKNTKTYLWVDLDPTVAPGLETAILRSDKEMESTEYKDIYTDEQEKSMLDLLNLLYVAMTRPEERLYILSKSPSVVKEAPDSWPAFFDFFLKSEGTWNEGKVTYEFGTRVDHQRKGSKEKIDVVVLNNLINSNWRGKINIKLRAPQIWDIDQPVTKPQWGNRLHTMLSWIRTEKDVAAAVGKAALTGLIDNADRETLEKILVSVVLDPRLARYFSEDVVVKTEAEILLPGGSFYRPDRVVFDGDLVTILDYKSGKPMEEHKEQMLKYAGYIAEMGYVNIARILVYLDQELSVAEA
ncbi:MAG: UvrD-helicase domain-containing protein [Bacteroidota bacterium]